jgi:RNA polymerase sigma factor (sigma-70 family)
MATSPMSEVMQHFRRITLLRDGADLSDGQLLEDYINRRDPGALAALVRRHAPMVWGVCRRVLPDYHDAEDAFQATFLVLVRKAASIASRELLANWLYGVAHRTALKARSIAARRKRRERQVAKVPEPAAAEEDLWGDLQPLLDQELCRLPDKYRAVVVLCDLEGRSRKEAARRLGCPEGTVAGRLARARTILAKRFAQHGLAVSAGTLAAGTYHQAASAAVPASLVSSILKVLALAAAGQAAAGMISTRVMILTEGVLKAMSLAKFKMAVVMGLTIASICGAVFVAQAQDTAKNAVAPRTIARSDGPPLKDFLITLDKQLWEASAKGDWRVYQTLLAEDYFGFSADGRFNKHANVEAVKRRRYSDWTIRDTEFKRISDDVAILTYSYDCKVTEGVVVQHYRSHRASFTWAQRDGVWVLVFSQDTVQSDTGRIRRIELQFRRP